MNKSLPPLTSLIFHTSHTSTDSIWSVENLHKSDQKCYVCSFIDKKVELVFDVCVVKTLTRVAFHECTNALSETQ